MPAAGSKYGPPGIFVTGTDTAVGKTLFASALVRVLAEQGHQVAGLKPVASGAVAGDHGLRNEDALALAAESTVTLPYELTNPYCFAPAIAPHLAAREAGIEVSVPELIRWYERAGQGLDIAVVEGAGGWRVPLHPDGFLSDLPERLGWPVILVVGLRLGCLNHARLTYEAIAAAGRCRLAGWVANQLDPGFAGLDENLAALAVLLGAPPLSLVPMLEAPSAAAAAARLDRSRILRAVFPPL
jgi:dethiobiotin synthetase